MDTRVYKILLSPGLILLCIPEKINLAGVGAKKKKKKLEKLAFANLIFFPIYYLVHKLYGLCPSGLWVLETKTKAFETHLFFSYTTLCHNI